jgi:hypothetical protein
VLLIHCNKSNKSSLQRSVETRAQFKSAASAPCVMNKGDETAVALKMLLSVLMAKPWVNGHHRDEDRLLAQHLHEHAVTLEGI